MSELVTVTQAADTLKLTPQAIYLMIDEGRISSRVELNRIAIPRSEVQRVKRLRAKRAKRNGNSK